MNCFMGSLFLWQCLEEAIARHSGMKDDLHIPPFALFEMASIYMKKPEVRYTRHGPL